MIFEGSDYTGSAPNTFQSWHFRHNGLLFAADGNNLQFDPSSGLITVYGTLVTSGRGIYSIVGPTAGFPADTGATVNLAQVGVTTLRIAAFHPQSTKKLTLRVQGDLQIAVPNGGTWTIVLNFVNARGVAVARTLRLTRDTGADGTNAAAAGSFSFQGNCLHQAQAGGANAVTVDLAVAGAGGTQDFDVACILEWGDAE